MASLLMWKGQVSRHPSTQESIRTTRTSSNVTYGQPRAGNLTGHTRVGLLVLPGLCHRFESLVGPMRVAISSSEKLLEFWVCTENHCSKHRARDERSFLLDQAIMGEMIQGPVYGQKAMGLSRRPFTFTARERGLRVQHPRLRTSRSASRVFV